jgi:hypothetical protein
MIWIKALAATAPLLLGALIGVAWSNSHAMVAALTRIDNTEKQIDRLRDMVERHLCPPPGAPK